MEGEGGGEGERVLEGEEPQPAMAAVAVKVLRVVGLTVELGSVDLHATVGSKSATDLDSLQGEGGEGGGGGEGCIRLIGL